MAVHAAQVGQDQSVGSHLSICSGDSHLFKYAGNGGHQVIARYVDRLFLFNAELR